MGNTKSKPYHHGNLRDALIDAALILLEEKGRDAFTLREVARRAEVSHAAPYRHFKDKRSLLESLIETGFVTLTDAIEEELANLDAPSPARAFEVWGVKYVELALRKPGLFALMFGERMTPPDRPDSSLAADRLLDSLVSLIERSRGSSRTDMDAKRIAQIGWCQVHGVAQLILMGQLEIETDDEALELTVQAVEVVVSGAGLERSST
jgi:AcrR family transcriptional regulator